MDGELTKVCRKKEKKRWFVLFSDCLIYSEIDIKAKFMKPRIHETKSLLVLDIPDPEGFIFEIFLFFKFYFFYFYFIFILFLFYFYFLFFVCILFLFLFFFFQEKHI